MSEVASLSATGIDVSFEGVHALRGVDISLRRDMVLGLIGPNGAGKTTLLKTIAGTLRPSRGTVRIMGEDVTRLSPARRHRLARQLRFEVEQAVKH